MRLLRLLILILTFAILLTGSSNFASAQSYSFQVPEQVVTVQVNEDGSLTLDYLITFAVSSGSDPIDIVDIGLPNENYDINSITAEINGVPLSDIRVSEFVYPGVEIHLDSNEIGPGQTSSLHINIGRVDYALGASAVEGSEDYASIVFSPSFFDPGMVSGNTNFTVSIVLPPGLTSEEPRYHTPSNNWPGGDDPEAYYDNQERVVYTWFSNEADAETEYLFGASFPIRFVPPEVVVATETPNSRTFDLESLIPCGCFTAFALIFVAITYFGIKSSRARRMQYLPPKISIEGHGIKRGLTAVEAAILMEEPLEKIMTMVLFSVLKKGAALVLDKDPLKLEIAEHLPDGLQPYELTFLQAFKMEKSSERRLMLQNMTVDLIKSVGEKLKGFSRKETLAYYQSIIEAAWKQVTDAGTPEVQAEKYEEVMDWTMADKEWEGRTRETFGTRPVIIPTWWWRYDPVFRTSATGGGTVQTSAPRPLTIPGSSGQGSLTLPKLPGSDFAASVAGGVETFASNVIGDVTTFTSSITNRTNPVPVSQTTRSSGGGRSSGGSSCVCACACACAGCACACAGGGR